MGTDKPLLEPDERNWLISLLGLYEGALLGIEDKPSAEAREMARKIRTKLMVRMKRKFRRKCKECGENPCIKGVYCK